MKLKTDTFSKLEEFYPKKQDRVVLLQTCLSLIVAFFVFTIWFFSPPYLPSTLPLFYSLPWGEKQLAQHQQFIVIPGIIIIVTLLNLIISWHLHPTQKIIKRVLSSASLLITTLLLFTFLKIIFLFT